MSDRFRKLRLSIQPRRKLAFALTALAVLSSTAVFVLTDSLRDDGGRSTGVEAAYLSTSAPSLKLTKTVTPTITLKNEGGEKSEAESHADKTAFLRPISPEEHTPSQFKKAMTTLFWAGEKATHDNGYIANSESFWDSKWAFHFGGTDDPERRCGFRPCSFSPKENPFYVALPYGELDDSGRLKANAHSIPLQLIAHDARSPSLKNHWVEIRRGARTCYGQWEDVGPFEADDFGYVFGSAQTPKNRNGVGAGLDISPALWKCLGLESNAVTNWRLVSDAEVPSGPWKEIVTKSGIKQ